MSHNCTTLRPVILIFAHSALHFGARKIDVSFSPSPSPSPSPPDYNHFLRRGYDRGDTSVVYR